MMRGREGDKKLGTDKNETEREKGDDVAAEQKLRERGRGKIICGRRGGKKKLIFTPLLLPHWGHALMTSAWRGGSPKG